MKYLSALLTQASGSLGGATAAKNRGGNYLRAKIAPVQPRTVAQQEQRANLAALAGAWKALTQAQIAGWNSLASTLTLQDPLGNSYVPTGEQIYVGNNRNLSQAAETSVEDPPTAKPDFADITPVGMTAVSGGTPSMTATTALAAAPTENVFIVRATPMISAGISFIGASRYRIIGHFAASTYASMNILADYQAKFGDLVSGAKIGLAVDMVSIATGFASTRATTSVIVT